MVSLHQDQDEPLSSTHGLAQLRAPHGAIFAKSFSILISSEVTN